jgi:hypothetical protein
MWEINGLDMIDLLAVIKRRQGRYLSLLLNDVEEELNDAEKYKIIRKYILDNFNDYTRSVFRILLGDDIEGLTF